jgi:uncharacterized protein
LRVFLDTNVLVSAIATRGLSADVFRLVLDKHEFITAEPVLQETERVLALKFHFPPDVVEQTLRFLRRFPVEPMPGEPSSAQTADPDDRWILEAAIQADADVLVTGDRDFLAVAKEVNRPRILSPRAFWELHRELHS